MPPTVCAHRTRPSTSSPPVEHSARTTQRRLSYAATLHATPSIPPSTRAQSPFCIEVLLPPFPVSNNSLLTICARRSPFVTCHTPPAILHPATPTMHASPSFRHNILILSHRQSLALMKPPIHPDRVAFYEGLRLSGVQQLTALWRQVGPLKNTFTCVWRGEREGVGII